MPASSNLLRFFVSLRNGVGERGAFKRLAIAGDARGADFGQRLDQTLGKLGLDSGIGRVGGDVRDLIGVAAQDVDGKPVAEPKPVTSSFA